MSRMIFVFIFVALVAVLSAVFLVVQQPTQEITSEPTSTLTMSQLKGKWKVMTVERGGQKKEDHTEFVEIWEETPIWWIAVRNGNKTYTQEFRGKCKLDNGTLHIIKAHSTVLKLKVTLDGDWLYWDDGKGFRSTMKRVIDVK